MAQVVLHPSEVLATICNPVRDFDDDLIRLILEMHKTMREHNGMGLAAPQIGVALQVIIMELPPQLVKGSKIKPIPFTVIINPLVNKCSPDIRPLPEQCLSCPGIDRTILRPKSIYLTYMQQNGKRQNHKFTDLPARILQHELDHIAGVCIADLPSQGNFIA